MKIEQLLVQHFYNAGEVTLQGMGTFTLSPDFVMPKEQDKDLEIPSNAILFQYNSKATEDDGLINYIVEQTRKMKWHWKVFPGPYPVLWASQNQALK